ncbi:MAG: glycoside hydrolase family 127 protein, partial [Oscillospiraceae bacterium]|nr:glycoside hydrolase family 127 protein [Oscillospiraceae bacterium]
TGGFWKGRDELNFAATLPAVQKSFEASGRFAAFRCDWREGQPRKPHFFWDSDVAKWMEGAAYALARHPDSALEAFVEELIDRIEEHQEENGYFNIYFTVCEPDGRFRRRDCHELYCAGHLMEAAVAWYESTGRDRFLRIMCRYADCIARAFKIEGTAAFATPGHEEIELALLRLFRCTGERRYLELAQFFIDQRGGNTKDASGFIDWAQPSYDQSHCPARAQHSAEGHSVRACYFYAAMAGLAKETGDTALQAACASIFTDIVTKKMYVTGGIGQSHVGEAFTLPYDLPNASAYNETCAAIALVFFARRMQALSPKAVYADVIERLLYNAALSGVSLDGSAFFYENPLECQPALRHRDASVRPQHRGRMPATRRVVDFSCSCCPPNVTRFFASIGEDCFGAANGGYYVHQYMPCEMVHGGARIRVETNYPADGEVRVFAERCRFIALRIPQWCAAFSLNVDYTLCEGYAVIERPMGEIALRLQMQPVLLQASNRVRENNGKAAMQRGPVIYCLEEADNGPLLNNLSVARDCRPTVAFDAALGVPVISAEGLRLPDSEALYAPLSQERQPAVLRFIPYFAFANREEGEMAVWVRVE